MAGVVQLEAQALTSEKISLIPVGLRNRLPPPWLSYSLAASQTPRPLKILILPTSLDACKAQRTTTSEN